MDKLNNYSNYYNTLCTCTSPLLPCQHQHNTWGTIQPGLVSHDSWHTRGDGHHANIQNKTSDHVNTDTACLLPQWHLLHHRYQAPPPGLGETRNLWCLQCHHNRAPKIFPLYQPGIQEIDIAMYIELFSKFIIILFFILHLQCILL